MTSPENVVYNLPSDMCDHQSVAIHWVPLAMPPPSTESPADVTCEEREGWTFSPGEHLRNSTRYWQYLAIDIGETLEYLIYINLRTTTDDTTARNTAAGNCSLTNIAIVLEYYFGNLGNFLLS